MWERMQQMLLQRGINTYLELALWITLVYIVIGVGYAMFHIELIGQLEAALSGDFTIFANIAGPGRGRRALAAAVDQLVGLWGGRVWSLLTMTFRARRSLYRHD